MKTITINGKILKYHTFELTDLDYGIDYYQTVFYDGTREVIKTYKKYWLFGPIIIKKTIENIRIFSISGSPDDPSLSKEWWKERIEKELNAHILLEKRKEEIKIGELI